VDISDLFDLVLHVDRHLNDWAGALGPWLYVILFLIIFCETGLVVTPHLPGDSLLFAVGALASREGSPIHIGLVTVLLCVAAILGDTVNYSIGFRLGPRVFSREKSRWFHKKHLERAQRFYEQYGAKTIVLARFMPIVRTFAPFVAGIGRMNYRRFAFYNVAGGIIWCVSFLSAGYFFADLPVVQKNFHLVILGIIVLSCIPPAIEFFRARRKGPETPAEQPAGE
jgi:membrane-associated protein